LIIIISLGTLKFSVAPFPNVVARPSSTPLVGTMAVATTVAAASVEALTMIVWAGVSVIPVPTSEVMMGEFEMFPKA